jgi:acetoacetyl-CoA reductase
MAAAGRELRAYPVDMADYEACQACMTQILADVGRVDILVNNAGITRDLAFKKMDKVNWVAVIRTNLDSVFNVTKPLCEGMVERGWGRIINIASISMAPRVPSVPTTRPRRPACTASPSGWRRKWQERA